MSGTRVEVELITFDLDNTLWDVDTIIIRAETTMREWMGAEAPSALEVYTSDALHDIRASVFARHAHMRHDLTHMRIEVLNEVMLRAGHNQAQARALAEAAFDVFFVGRNTVEFFPHALNTLATLAERCQLYALTNGNADIERAGLGPYFAGAFSSADVGASKPDPAMFHAALAATGLDPKAAVHVGDNLVDDIQGAQKVGMQTVWVNLGDAALEPEGVTPDAIVTSLGELPDAIARLS